MTRKSGVEEALRRLARAGRVKANRDSTERLQVKPAHRSDANEEFSDPPSANTALCVGILIALALIDFFAMKWLPF